MFRTRQQDQSGNPSVPTAVPDPENCAISQTMATRTALTCRMGETGAFSVGMGRSKAHQHRFHDVFLTALAFAAFSASANFFTNLSGALSKSFLQLLQHSLNSCPL